MLRVVVIWIVLVVIVLPASGTVSSAPAASSPASTSAALGKAVPLLPIIAAIAPAAHAVMLIPT